MGSRRVLVAGVLVGILAASVTTTAFGAGSGDTDDHVVLTDQGLGGFVASPVEFTGTLNGSPVVPVICNVWQQSFVSGTGLTMFATPPMISSVSDPCHIGSTSTPVNVTVNPSGWSARYRDAGNDEAAPEGPGTVDHFKLMMPMDAFTIPFANGCTVTFDPSATFLIGSKYVENSETFNLGKRQVPVAASGVGCTVVSPWTIFVDRGNVYPMEDQG